MKLFIYRLDDGGAGFVKAKNSVDALWRVKKSYGKDCEDGPFGVYATIIGELDDGMFNADGIAEIAGNIEITPL